MGIEELTIKGFRSLRDVTWKPGRLNVVIGPNGSGKSNLLQSLVLLQSSAAGRLSEEIVRHGGIGQLLWDGQEQEISWRLQTGEARYELDLQQLGDSSVYRVERESLQYQDRTPIERDTTQAVLRDGEKNVVRVHVNTYPQDKSLLSAATGPFSGVDAYSFRNSILSWTVYHDLRVDRSAPLRRSAVARFEKRIEADGQNLTAVLHTLYSNDREFRESVDGAMRAAFGRDYEELIFPPAADQLIQLRLRWRSLKTTQSAANLSDGTLRFLLLIAILCNPEPGDLIAIDEPETGLHPGMLPILAELAAEAAERTQVVFTTHSPQFLDAFEGDPPTTTVAQWEEGETKLSVWDNEELQRWIKDYSLGSLFLSGELEGMA